jgi:hypothetical protein
MISVEVDRFFALDGVTSDTAVPTAKSRPPSERSPPGSTGRR